MSWSSPNGAAYTINPTDAGRTAFIFNLTSGVFQAQRLGDTTGQYQTLNYLPYGPTFGGGHDLTIHTADASLGYVLSYTYGGGLNTPNLFGNNGPTLFTSTRVETFTIANGTSAVPEPATWLLLGTALVGLGFRRRT